MTNYDVVARMNYAVIASGVKAVITVEYAREYFSDNTVSSFKDTLETMSQQITEDVRKVVQASG